MRTWTGFLSGALDIDMSIYKKKTKKTKSVGRAPEEEVFLPNAELKNDLGSLGWETASQHCL